MGYFIVNPGSLFPCVLQFGALYRLPCERRNAVLLNVRKSTYHLYHRYNYHYHDHYLLPLHTVEIDMLLLAVLLVSLPHGRNTDTESPHGAQAIDIRNTHRVGSSCSALLP